MRAALLLTIIPALFVAVAIACERPLHPIVDAGAPEAGDAGTIDAGTDGTVDAGADGTVDAGADGTVDGGTVDGGTDAGPAGPIVDRGNPRLIELDVETSAADPEATLHAATELAQLDTRVAPVGLLVVYLHGAGAPTVCGARDHGRMLAARGFHVVAPCYVSDYGVGNCGDDIEGCRLEAFEGVDHHPFITIAPADSIERRVVKLLQLLDAQEPAGDWGFFVDGDRPRWSHIVISGISHGASSSGVIAMHRSVARAVMLSGPFDVGQAWLASATSLTPRDRFFGFSHVADDQHAGHLTAFASLGLPGEPVDVDVTAPPYGSQRFISNTPSSSGHGSTQAGGSSPLDGSGAFAFLPVWAAMYGP